MQIGKHWARPAPLWVTWSRLRPLPALPRHITCSRPAQRAAVPAARHSRASLLLHKVHSALRDSRRPPRVSPTCVNFSAAYHKHSKIEIMNEKHPLWRTCTGLLYWTCLNRVSVSERRVCRRVPYLNITRNILLFYHCLITISSLINFIRPNSRKIQNPPLWSAVWQSRAKVIWFSRDNFFIFG